MLYMMSLSHTPDQCPGVAVEIRDRVVRMNATMTEYYRATGALCRADGSAKVLT